MSLRFGTRHEAERLATDLMGEGGKVHVRRALGGEVAYLVNYESWRQVETYVAALAGGLVLLALAAGSLSLPMQ